MIGNALCRLPLGALVAETIPLAQASAHYPIQVAVRLTSALPEYAPACQP